MSTARLRMVTLNPGDHVKYDDVMRTLDGGQRGSIIHGAALQEMFNNQATKVLERILRGNEWGMVTRDGGHVPEANPFLFRREYMRLMRNDSFHLLDAGTRLGKHNMEKYAVGGLFRFHPAARPIECFSIHNIQTQVGSRAEAATLHNKRLNDGAADWRIPTFIGGDWNASVRSRSQAPMAHWRYDQAIKPMVTHDIRPIDGWKWQNHDRQRHVVDYVRHWTDPKVDDHRPDFCEWDLLVKEAA